MIYARKFLNMMKTIAEKQHEKTFVQLAENIKTDSIFKRDKNLLWRCRNCGYLHEGESVPEKCPECVRPGGHFELLTENW